MLPETVLARNRPLPQHKDSRILPYTADQMYALVADIERYPEFLPWNTAARIRLRRPGPDGSEMVEAYDRVPALSHAGDLTVDRASVMSHGQTVDQNGVRVGDAVWQMARETVTIASATRIRPGECRVPSHMGTLFDSQRGGSPSPRRGGRALSSVLSA